MGRVGLPVALGLLALVGGGACGERRNDELCDDTADRLTFEVEQLATACRRDADCRPVQVECGGFTPMSAAEVPQRLTRLAERYEALDCCDVAFDDSVPPAPPVVTCAAPDTGPGRCEVTP